MWYLLRGSKQHIRIRRWKTVCVRNAYLKAEYLSTPLAGKSLSVSCKSCPNIRGDSQHHACSLLPWQRGDHCQIPQAAGFTQKFQKLIKFYLQNLRKINLWKENQQQYLALREILKKTLVLLSTASLAGDSYWDCERC